MEQLEFISKLFEHLSLICGDKTLGHPRRSFRTFDAILVAHKLIGIKAHAEMFRKLSLN